MSAMDLARISTPVGILELAADQQYLRSIQFLSGQRRLASSHNPVLLETIAQLHQYFENPAFTFSIVPESCGTRYQNQVWACLRRIQPGKTLTYSEVSKHAGGSARSVGNACRANPFVIITPCHRVVATTGPGGFSGKTAGHYLEIKTWLLEHEQTRARKLQ